MEPKDYYIALIYVFEIWFNRSEISSIVDFGLGSKYAFVNITLQLTFFERTYFIESY